MVVPLVWQNHKSFYKILTYASFLFNPNEVDAETVVNENFPQLGVKRFKSEFFGA